MELSPQAVAAATFKTVKRGYDPDEVRSYLVEVSTALEASQQQATAMEARARAAIAKLQEATQAGTASAPPSEEAEVISRTLLLAQRTADATIAEARTEAAEMRRHAEADAEAAREAAAAQAADRLAAAQAQVSAMLDEARSEVQRVRDEEHVRAEQDVARLTARRDALVIDLDQLEQHLVAQRERVRMAASTLLELVDRVPAGLADVARPSASGGDAPSGTGDPDGDDTAETEAPSASNGQAPSSEDATPPAGSEFAAPVGDPTPAGGAEVPEAR